MESTDSLERNSQASAATASTATGGDGAQSLHSIQTSLSRQSTDVPGSEVAASRADSADLSIAARTSNASVGTCDIATAVRTASMDVQVDQAVGQMMQADLPGAISQEVGLPATDAMEMSHSTSRNHKAVFRPTDHTLTENSGNEKQKEALFQADMFKEEYMISLGCVSQGLAQATRDSVVKRGCFDFILVFLFIVVIQLANPVSSVFEIQDGIAQSLARASINSTGLRAKTDFYAIKSYDQFWAWATNVLYPQVYNSSLSPGAYGQSNAFAIARYNRLVTPIRFRQVRVKKDACDVPEENHMLSRPCWPAYSPTLPFLAKADMEEFAFANATFKGDGLSTLLGEYEDIGSSYGTGGHVIDLELDAAPALTKLNHMVKDRWTDEWTQILSVDVNTYNPNYDMATVFRFKVVRSIGGQLTPHVETCSCRLNGVTENDIKLPLNLGLLEAMWMLIFCIYLLVTVFWWIRGGYKECCSRKRSGLELFNLLWFGAIISWWVLHSQEDHAAFRSRSPLQFQDMYSMCYGFHVMTNFAALSMVLVCFQLLRALKVFSSFSTVYRVLASSVNKVVPFILVLILGLVLFSFSAMWLFGTRVRGLQTWYHALGVLSHSLAAGKHNLYLFEQMSDVSTSVAGVWMMVWILLSSFVFTNMFVSVLSSAMFAIRGQKPHEQKLAESCPAASFTTYLKAKVPRLWRDPDTQELIRILMVEVAVWRAHLRAVDVEKLQTVVDELMAEGKTLLRVQDAMKLFPHKSEEVSYKNAGHWIKSLSDALGVRMVDTDVKPSTSSEIKQLTQGCCKLEEEVYGLGLQLRRVLRNGAPKARAI